MLNITITPMRADWQTPEDVEDDGISWSMVFSIEDEETGIRFKFIWEEPYIVSLAEWKRMANGVEGLYSSYMGNGDGDGEGSIKIEDSRMIFVAAPSGSGGDVTSEYSIPFGYLCPQLQKAVEEAQKNNFPFAKE